MNVALQTSRNAERRHSGARVRTTIWDSRSALEGIDKESYREHRGKCKRRILCGRACRAQFVGLRGDDRQNNFFVSVPRRAAPHPTAFSTAQGRMNNGSVVSDWFSLKRRVHRRDTRCLVPQPSSASTLFPAPRCPTRLLHTDGQHGDSYASFVVGLWLADADLLITHPRDPPREEKGSGHAVLLRKSTEVAMLVLCDQLGSCDADEDHAVLVAVKDFQASREVLRKGGET
nr:hypothetical protein CFP56_31644 [Quercus suber]